MFITGINARDKILHFEKLASILMQEEERRLTLKPQSADLALVVRKNFYKGKGGPQQRNGSSSHKRPNLTQGMHPNKNSNTMIKMAMFVLKKKKPLVISTKESLNQEILALQNALHCSSALHIKYNIWF